MYHTDTLCFLHIAFCTVFLCAIIFVRGSAMGIALKYNCPNICAYADNLGFIPYFINKLIVIYACFTIRHHKYIGKLLYTDANPITKLFLKVRIAQSSEFLL